MSYSPAIPIYKPLKIQAGIRQAKVRLAASDLLDIDADVAGILNLDELARKLDPPMERIVVDRKLRRFLPVLAIHRTLKHSSREKAFELLVRRRSLMAPQTLLNLYEEYYDRPPLVAYIRERYPAGQSFGAFSREQLLVDKPAEYFQKLLFEDRACQLREFTNQAGLSSGSRLATEVLALQLEHPPLEWLRKLEKEDLEALFALCSTTKERFKYFEAWLKILCGGKLPTTRSELWENKNARQLVNWGTARHRLGDPFEAALRWQQATPELLRLIQLSLFEKEIDDFFSSDDTSDRFLFWRKFADQCSGMKRFSRQNAFAIKIGQLWFVEFVPTGACYIYSEANFKRVTTERGYDLKERDLCVPYSISVQGSTGVAVLTPPLSHVHRGVGRSYTWQRQFTEYIRKHAL